MKRRGKALTKMIISYSVMVCIPVLISMAVYAFTYGVVKQQARAYDESMIHVIQSSCDSEIRYYKGILESLRAENELQQMGRNQDYDSGKDYWNDYLGQKLLFDNGKYITSYCHDMFIWLGTKGKVVNMVSSMSYELYEKIVCQDNAEVSGRLKTAMTEARESTAIGVSIGKKSYVILLEPVIGVGIEKGAAVLGLWLDMDALNHQINSMEWEKEMEWVLVDSHGNVLRDAERFSVTELEAAALLEGRNVSVEGEEYLVTSIGSDFYGMKYILFTPESMVETPANRIRTVNLFSLFLVLVTGCVASVYFTKMHYHPLKSVLGLFSGIESSEGISNEYEFIKTHVSNIMKENRNAEKRSTSLSRLYALESLLTDKMPDGSFRETWEALSKKFRDGNNLVLVFREKGGFYSQEQTGGIQEEGLRRFVVSNIFAEALGELFQEETFTYGNRVVTILNIPEGEERYAELLHSEVEAKRDFIFQNFQFSFCVLEGGAHPGLSGISRSWQEACQAEAFLNDLDEMYIRYEEIRDQSVYSYSYSFAMEESIVGAIRSGDAGLAQSIIDDLIEKSFGGTQNTVSEMHMCMLYDIYGTLVKAAEEQGCNVARFPQLRIGSDIKSVAVMREHFRETIEQICRTVEQPAQDRQGKRLSTVIQEYVEEHYRDPDLNVSQIAYHLHMTPAWVSATFKKQTGKSLLGAIKQVRISEAKRLLAEGCSVLEVTKLTGFRESTTFIKIFKSSTGVTPGQYRKMNQNETDGSNIN